MCVCAFVGLGQWGGESQQFSKAIFPQSCSIFIMQIERNRAKGKKPELCRETSNQPRSFRCSVFSLNITSVGG